MIICSCYGLTDRDIREDSRSGGCGTRAGTRCGTCRRAVMEIIEGASQQTARDRERPREKTDRDDRA